MLNVLEPGNVGPSKSLAYCLVLHLSNYIPYTKVEMYA
jgi:hypothetical protein